MPMKNEEIIKANNTKRNQYVLEIAKINIDIFDLEELLNCNSIDALSKADQARNKIDALNFEIEILELMIEGIDLLNEQIQWHLENGFNVIEENNDIRCCRLN